MSIKMQNGCIWIVCTQPAQSKVDAVELQHRTLVSMLNERINIIEHVNIVRFFCHIQISVNPILFVKIG